VFTCVRAGGKVVSITGPLAPEGIPAGVSGPRRALVRPVAAGKLKLSIDSAYPLDDFASAFARLESRRAKGKVIIVMPS
jgi:D-arabinose 1-dehydrogenase-like Zn-dependent alcohol dehydrogenase